MIWGENMVIRSEAALEQCLTDKLVRGYEKVKISSQRGLEKNLNRTGNF